MFDIWGSDLRIPLTRATQPFCWSHPHLGVVLEAPGDRTRVNNAAFYRIIFHCGGSSHAIILLFGLQ